MNVFNREIGEWAHAVIVCSGLVDLCNPRMFELSQYLRFVLKATQHGLGHSGSSHPFECDLASGLILYQPGSFSSIGIIALVPGEYPRAAGNAFTAGAEGRAITFLAPAGLAVIGN